MHLRATSKLSLLLLVGLLFVVQPSWAGRVVKVKKKGKIQRVYIKLSPSEVDSTFKGDKLYVTTKSGKKKGLVIVRGIRGNQVVAQLKGGKARKGYRTRPKKGKKKKRRRKSEEMESATEVAETDTNNDEPSDMYIGILGAFGSATQNVANVADMSGSSLGIKGVFDYNILDGFGVKAQIGMDMLTVSGTAGTQEFETSINYLTIDMLIRYNMMFGSSFGIYLNGGMGIYSPMSTDLGDNAALQEDSISTTSLLILGGGVVIPFGSMQIQLGGDYLYFPPSDDVDTSIIAGKLTLLFAL